MPNLLAISDLHVGYADNKEYVDDIRAESEGDWIIVAGDVADRFDQIVSTLSALRGRFDKVIWTPGNHELWTLPGDPVEARGVARYMKLVDALRGVGVVTPEDPYPIWETFDGPVVIAPLFVLYDFTFLPAGAKSKADGLDIAEAAGVLCTDDVLLHCDPYPSQEVWSAARLEYTQARLDALPSSAHTVLVSHFPLVREPTRRLRYPEFALWCGTEHTASWPVRYRAEAVVYGHLHIPISARFHGIPHHEVSLGYPHEWRGVTATTRRVVRVLGEGESVHEC